MSEGNRLLDILLDFGEMMVGAGGEISRVEDSLARMGVAYGATRTSVFIIPSSIELTMAFSDGDTVTRTRRMKNAPDTDFQKLQALNALSRRCAMDRLPVDRLEEEIENIRTMRVHPLKVYIGSGLAAGAFSMFFGGTLLDGILALAFGLLIAWLQFHWTPLTPNKIFNLFSSSFFLGVGVCLTAKWIPAMNIDKVTIGVIMLLIPGVAITNATRDALIGDTISGITKLADALLWAAAQAAGIMVAILLFVR